MPNFFLNSLKYIVVSGVSKGFNYFILLYFAIGAYSKQYVAILLLVSLEQLLSLLLPLNNSYIIYSKKITKYEFITNKLISSSLVIMFVYVVLFLLFRNIIYEYFEVKKVIIFLSLFLSMIINAYMVYLTNYYKLIEKHDKALLIQALLFISFIIIIISVIFIEDKIVAFFFGKAIGLCLILGITKLLNLNTFKFKFKVLNQDEIKKMINLFSISILGWVSGLGFLNFAKLYSTPEELVKIGYILNICNVFLLISIGVNSVYNPLIKKNILKKDFKSTIRIKYNTLFIYLGIALGAFLLYCIVLKTFNFDRNLKIKEILLIVPFSIIIFVFNSFQSVAQPFYLIYEKFKTFNIVNVISYLCWILLMLICFNFGYKNFVWFLIVIHFFKALFSYFYARAFFMKKG